MKYAIMYSTTLLSCLIMTMILFIYHSRYWNPVTHIPLKMIYLLNMTSALMCVIWAFIDGKPELSVLNYIVNIIEFNCMGYAAYFWLIYCLKFVDIPALKTRLAKVLITVPIAVVTLIILSSPCTHWAFYIDEGGFFQRGCFYRMQQTGYLYLAASFIICLLGRKKCTTSRERRRLKVLTMFPVSPAVLGLIQIIAPSGIAPTLQFSILISMIMVFVDQLDQKITRDSLTQLINHYEFERILQNKMHNSRNHGAGLYVLMSDSNDFKNINDTYGHLQGDASLRMVGVVMTKAAAKHKAVCARRSGDEFVSLLETHSSEDVSAYIEDLKQGLEEACSHLPYTLQFSTGVAEYDGKMTLLQLLDQADKNMYEEKRLHRHPGLIKN